MLLHLCMCTSQQLEHKLGDGKSLHLAWVLCCFVGGQRPSSDSVVALSVVPSSGSSLLEITKGKKRESLGFVDVYTERLPCRSVTTLSLIVVKSISQTLHLENTVS